MSVSVIICIKKKIPSARAASLRLLIAKKKAINSKITHNNHKALKPTVAIFYFLSSIELRKEKEKIEFKDIKKERKEKRKLLS